MIIERILSAAEPYLEGRTIQDGVMGLSLIGIQLDNENLGLSYVLRETLPAGCSVFPYGHDLIGTSAIEAAHWALTGKEDLQRAIGMAVLTAASKSQNLKDVENAGQLFGLTVLPTDRVGMIGYIVPVAKELEQKAKEVIVFDMGMSLRGGSKGEVSPMEEQKSLLPTCDLVILSGTTVINHTIDQLLTLSQNAREVVLVGSSTPMFPEAFHGTNVTVLAGSWWVDDQKGAIFKEISLACGISRLHPYMIKKAVRVGQ